MIDLDEVMRRKDHGHTTNDEVRCLIHAVERYRAEIERLRALNLQLAEQVTCEHEHARVARLRRDEAEELAEELRCELRLARQQLADQMLEWRKNF